MVKRQDVGPLNQNFEKLVLETSQLWHVPGVSVAHVDGKHIWAKGYGIAAFPSTPVTPSTLFYAGSTTKAFTAAIMTLLVDDNLEYPHIQWATPIHQLLPNDFVLKNEYATTHITIEDALSHRSGLPGHDCSLGSAASGVTVQSIVRSLRHLPITAEPRTTYQYRNIMFIVASHVIETVTKRKLGDLIKEWIWEPLGMNSSYFDLHSAKTAREDLAHGYSYLYHTDDGGFKDLGCNVLDYAKWASAILSKSLPLSKDGFKAWLTPRTITPFAPPFIGPILYALGWRIGIYRGHQFYAHSGGMKGYGAELLIFPSLDFAVVAMANTSGTSYFLGQKLIWHLVDEKLNVELEERFDWDKKNQKNISEGQYRSLNAASIIYPQLPSPTRPLPLPLFSYTGIYNHPAYGDLIIYLDSPKSSISSTSNPILRADRTKVIWDQTLLFEHVSGDFFVARSKADWDFGALYDDVYPVEFRIGSDGIVGDVGVGWEAAMGQEKIWLRRIE